METNNDIIYNLTKGILSECKEKSIDIRLFGSVALLFLDSSIIESIGKYSKIIADIDIIVKPNQIKELECLFMNRGYLANRRVKMLYGNERRSFYLENNLSIDVFIGNITLCQNLSILDRFDETYPTITTSDLFLTKIQKINLSDSDVYSINYILKFGIDFEYIIKLSSESWNWWKTLNKNIPFLLENNISEDNKRLLVDLMNEISSTEKTRSWKLRNFIGEKRSWYNNVE